MPPLVRGEHVQAGRETEAEDVDEGVGETHAGEINVGIAPEKLDDLLVRREER
jgi:hypothetical protein